MPVRRPMLAACCAALLASCGSPADPTAAVPDVRGVWSAGRSPWSWGISQDAGITSTAGCAGSLEIAEQTGDRFSGRYGINCPAGGASSGVVLDGRVHADGRLAFALRAEDGWSPALPPGRSEASCEVTSDTGVYQGAIANGELAAVRHQTLACMQGQRVAVSAAFRGARN